MYVELKWAVLDAFDFLDVVADFLEHVADLAVFSFYQRHFEPGIVGFAHGLNFGRGGAGPFAVFGADGDSSAQFGQVGNGGNASDFYQISFRNVRGGLHEGGSEFAVVGEQEQALAGVVEATDGIHASSDASD